MRKLVYSFENNGATWAKLRIDSSGRVVTSPSGEKQFKSDAEGSCFGYTWDWARRMLTGEPKDSKPSYAGGTPLQQRHEMVFNKGTGHRDQRNVEATRKIASITGFKLARHTTMSRGKIVATLQTAPGVYVYDIGIHWSGCAKVAGDWYLFDPNVGLVKCDTADEFRELLNQLHAEYKPHGRVTEKYNIYRIECGTS